MNQTHVTMADSHKQRSLNICRMWTIKTHFNAFRIINKLFLPLFLFEMKISHLRLSGPTLDELNNSFRM